jgi:hypothetical protein
MVDDIFVPTNLWSTNELNAMTKDGDLFNFESAFVTWTFIENASSRFLYLQLIYRQRIKPVGEIEQWVKIGGRFPSEIVLQEPRRKNYC